MEWTFENFEADLRDLNPKVQEKALEIATRLMKEGGYTKEKAIKEAIKEAEEWFLNRQA